jgi:nucleoside-triphosphatase THEP1
VARAVILTGERGAGKTTLCLDLARKHPRFRGIVSPAIYDAEGRKVGFSCLCLATGEKWDLGRSDSDLDGPRYGKYCFSARGLARAIACAEAALAQPGGVTVIDEIGPLELENGGGLAPLLGRLGAAGDLLVVTRPRFAGLLRAALPVHQVEEFTLKMEDRAGAARGILGLFGWNR